MSHFEVLHPRKWSKVEFEGAWICALVMLPVLLGQIAGWPIIGLLAGVGGLLLALTETASTTPRLLWAAVIINGLIMFAGTLIGHQSWLAVGLMFAIAFAGGAAAMRGESALQIGFIASVVFSFAIGQKVGTLATDAAHALALGAGGAWAAALTQILWRIKARVATPKARDSMNDISAIIALPHALRIASACAVAAMVYKLSDSPHGYWMIITVLVIVKPERRVTRERTTQRIVGSVVGGLAALVFVSFVHNLVVIDVLLIGLCVAAFSHFRTDYALFVMFLTPFVILLITSIAPGGWPLALARILDTFIGAAIAIAATHLLRRPKHVLAYV